MSDEQPYSVDSMHADGEPLANPPFGGIVPLAKLSHYLKQKCVCSWTWGSYYCDSQGPHRDYNPRAPALVTPTEDRIAVGVDVGRLDEGVRAGADPE